MRNAIAAIAAALVACASGGAARADLVTYAIDFSPLAGDAGQTVTATFFEAGFDITVRNALVIGPGDPNYSGSIGVIPAVNDLSLSIAPAPGSTFDWVSLSGTFATAGGSAVNWAGRADFTPPVTLLTYWQGTAPGTIAYTPGGAADPPIVYPTQTIDMEPVTGDTQLTGMAIVGVLVPEPSAAAMGGIGLGVVVLAAIRRRIRRRSGSCRASR